MNDFEVYAPMCLKIRDKEGNITPFRLNTAQKIALAIMELQRQTEGFIRVIILKGRQQGLSTLINGYLYRETSMRPGKKTIVVAHKADSTETLFQMTHRYHKNVPEPIRAHTKYSGKALLAFDALDSSYLVVTAGGDDIARGETLQGGHLSEVAFWPKGSAARNFNGLMKAFPPKPGVVCAIESTANGVSGVFADQWRQAVAGNNGFVPIFIPWYVTEEYTAKVPEGFKLTLEERELMERYGTYQMPDGSEIPGFCTEGQAQWRRLEIGMNGAEKFKQEYPFFPDEAFLTTGSPVFHAERVAEMRKTQVSHDYTRYTHASGAGFSENSRGELYIWREYDPSTQYFIGADVAMGYRGGDYSVAIVLDDLRRVVARYRAHVNPAYFAEILNDLGQMYGAPRLIVESNNHGILTLNKLNEEFAYPYLYTEETLDKQTQEYRTKLGFNTLGPSKAFIINELRTVIVDQTIEIPDRAILAELSTYVVDENGKMGAEKGTDVDGEKIHDDMVMALSMANHIHEERFVPVDVTDDYYVELPDG